MAAISSHVEKSLLTAVIITRFGDANYRPIPRPKMDS